MKMRLAKKIQCTGCTACYAACARGAISLKADFSGFFYPVVNESKCIGCGVCEKVCPVLYPYPKDECPDCYAARTLDAELLQKSTSGGLFTELAKTVLQNSGCVFGCILDGPSLEACHVKAESLEELAPMRGSKYVQSDLRNVLREVKLEVLKGRRVLFVGMPCQVAAVNRFVGKEYENLLTVDMICHSVPSPWLFDKFKREACRHAGSPLRRISFRRKIASWRQSCVSLEFEDYRRNLCEEYAKVDYCKLIFGLGGVGDRSGRDSCNWCVHKEGRSGADITIGDFWGIEDVARWPDDDKGTSALLVHSEKGRSLVDGIEGVCKLPVSITEVVKTNRAYEKSVDRRRFVGVHRILLRFLPLRLVVRFWVVFNWLVRISRKFSV